MTILVSKALPLKWNLSAFWQHTHNLIHLIELRLINWFPYIYINWLYVFHRNSKWIHISWVQIRREGFQSFETREGWNMNWFKYFESKVIVLTIREDLNLVRIEGKFTLFYLQLGVSWLILLIWVEIEERIVIKLYNNVAFWLLIFDFNLERR